MVHIYAMSDIHEELDLFKETLSLVDLSENNQLILLGDYIDIHSQDLSILYFIKEIQEKHKDQVIVLAGNHEFMLLEDIESKASSFNDAALINWLKGLPFYYETDTQIFVHAGIDEEAEELWKWGSEDYYFCSKYPHTTGKFFKDIIAGHVSTSEISGNADYHNVFWDKQSHFYIDGNTRVSKTIPVLKYDTASGKYSSFKKIKQVDGSFVWREYAIK
ncbi:metallophosphoesterase [Paenibacillus macerans]|uniref:metallophosphoesterase n=1 Tax=Paenibacillus macerans TaxID=44252 RepID=UPI00242B4FAA|nr:metallophosphoesterase [Paenibacillus macerans]MBS5909140.1 metallophosphoesterase [Paenibacillus macerans]MDU5946459.1 metallophosphoesterase [Paenibacillus macerans]MED4956398.1 metallophosphoesterase [Paenibacillus macerans]